MQPFGTFSVLNAEQKTLLLEIFTCTHAAKSSYECIAIINEGSVNFTTLNLSETLAKLSPIGLDAMDGAELMNRLDQKFLIEADWIPTLLLDCQDEYQILEVEGERITAYENQFVETPALDSFENHVRGRKNRFKARVRKYGSNGITFLEIKHKTVHGKTLKERVLRSKEEPWNAPLTNQETSFLNDRYPYPDGNLTNISNSFNRCTLVSTTRKERVTIDSQILFQSGEKQERLNGLAILEVKQSKIDRLSPIHKALKKYAGFPPPLGRQSSMSKYIIGMLLLNRELPPRTYRSIFRSIKRLKNFIPRP